MESVLVIDPDKQKYQGLKAILEFIDCESVQMSDPDQWKDKINSLDTIDAIFLADTVGQALPNVLKEITEWNSKLPVILMESLKSKIKIPSEQSTNIISRIKSPVKYRELTNALQQAHVYRDSQNKGQESISPELFRSLVGNSRGIRQVRKHIEQVAKSDTTVLILGESGTGKEIVARNVHYNSKRRDKSFVPINCGAIPSELLESELFGHEKGSFTGAISARQGRFEMAEGGTLFLDEIGDMSLHMQVKLLRVLQERTIERVGSNKTISVDVRIIAATHRDLEQAIKDGSFREDLYYRLNVFPIEMPPMRDRLEDVPLLIKELITRMEHEKRGSIRLTQAAILALCQYHWPGNVRELANLIERLVITHPYGVVDVHDLPQKFQHEEEAPNSLKEKISTGTTAMIMIDPLETPRLPRDGIDLKEHLSNLERNLIRQALDDAGGVVAHAANRLRLRRTTLVEKLRKYGIQRSEEVT